MGKKMALWGSDAADGTIGTGAGAGGVDKEAVGLLRERVGEAQRAAIVELREAKASGNGFGGKRRRRDGDGRGRDEMDRDDDVVEAGMPGRRKKVKGRR